MRRGLGILSIAALVSLTASAANAADTIRVGVLKFGTVNWEIDTIAYNKFDAVNGFKLEQVVLASNDATRIAINAGAVDVIVSDWLFVSRQRAEGTPLTFVPYSTSVGAIMVPKDSKAQTLGDLKGVKIGVAGGPLDKNWLMFQGMAKDKYGFDLAGETDPSFGAPPLLMEKFVQGEFGATSNFWNYNAKLEVEGYRDLVSGADAAAALGASGPISAIGYVFNETWANEHKDAMLGFVRASRQAKDLLAKSDAEWDRLRPLMQIDDDAVFKNTVKRYREGIPNRPIADEEADTAKIYEQLAKLGGEKLVGSATTMSPGTFWSGLKDVQ